MGAIQFIASDSDPVGFKQIHGFVNGNFDLYAKGRAVIARASHKKSGMIDIELPRGVVFVTMQPLKEMEAMFNAALDELEAGESIEKFVSDGADKWHQPGKFLCSYSEIRKAFLLETSNFNKNGVTQRTHK